MVYADDLKGGVTRSIHEFNVRAVQQSFLKNFQTIWQQINYKTLEKTALSITCDLSKYGISM